MNKIGSCAYEACMSQEGNWGGRYTLVRGINDVLHLTHADGNKAGTSDPADQPK